MRKESEKPAIGDCVRSSTGADETLSSYREARAERQQKRRAKTPADATARQSHTPRGAYWGIRCGPVMNPSSRLVSRRVNNATF